MLRVRRTGSRTLAMLIKSGTCRWEVWDQQQCAPSWNFS